MATWRVSTLSKKSVEEHEYWVKDGKTIIRVTGYRWGTWDVTTSDDEEPQFIRVRNPLGNEVEDSIDMYNCHDNNIEDSELYSLDDGWYADVEYPDDMDEQEQERMSELWDEDSYDGWESEGWVQTETECWTDSELKIEKLED
jgi:hypothetical protein